MAARCSPLAALVGQRVTHWISLRDLWPGEPGSSPGYHRQRCEGLGLHYLSRSTAGSPRRHFETTYQSLAAFHLEKAQSMPLKGRDTVCFCG